MRYLLDTNIPVSFFRGKKRVIEKLEEVINEGVGLSTVSLGELYHGVYKTSQVKQKRKEIEQFIKVLKILVLDRTVASEYGRLMAGLEKKGVKLAGMDVLIAATAKANKLTILTEDRKHFVRLRNFGIKVEAV